MRVLYFSYLRRLFSILTVVVGVFIFLFVIEIVTASPVDALTCSWQQSQNVWVDPPGYLEDQGGLVWVSSGYFEDQGGLVYVDSSYWAGCYEWEYDGNCYCFVEVWNPFCTWVEAGSWVWQSNWVWVDTSGWEWQSNWVWVDPPGYWEIQQVTFTETCPADDPGTCSYPFVCDNTGSRTQITYSCGAIGCESSSSIVPCARNTDGVACDTGKVCSGGSCVAAGCTIPGKYPSCTGSTCLAPTGIEEYYYYQAFYTDADCNGAADEGSPVTCGALEATTQYCSYDCGAMCVANDSPSCSPCTSGGTFCDTFGGRDYQCSCGCSFAAGCVCSRIWASTGLCTFCPSGCEDGYCKGAPADPCASVTCDPDQYCSGGICYDYCSGSDTECGSTACTNCNLSDGWANIGSSYNCCDNQKYCTNCQDQENLDYSCSGASCVSAVVGTQTIKNNCSLVAGQCGYMGNSPPSANNLSVTPPNSTDYCGITGFPPVRLGWRFWDPGDSQSAFQIQVFRLSDGTKVADTGKISGSSEEYVLQNFGERLEWNTGYSWQIIVWDSADIPSVWVAGPNFTTASHAFPIPDFLCNYQEDCAALRPSAEEVVTLTDNSTSDGGAVIISWSWDLPSQTDIVEGNTASAELKVTFNQGEDQRITLVVSDSDSYSCSIIKSINVTFPLPEWKEVPPVIWLRNFLAKISEFF